MSRAVSVSLQKGGVGKTTIAINLADALAVRENDVLLVDLDQQGNATEGVGMKDAYESADPNIGDVLTDDDPIDVKEVIHDREHFDVLPAHVDLDDIEDRVRNSTFGVLWVRRRIVDPLLDGEYDYLVIDSPPSLGPLSDAALIGTGNVVVPLLMSEPSVSGFERMFEQQIAPIRREVDLDILAIVPNDLTGNNEERRIIRDLESSPFEKFIPRFAQSDLFDDPESKGPGIRHRIAFSRAWRDGKTLREYDPTSDMLDRLDELAEIVEQGGRDDA
ncbi:ParA family protein (plasmid) [Haloferax mediterranei ATCC 33500]|uniref:Chromosome partitioning protein n=1 Tax=Haloferax mediterranei (strain ATCC 33500 / DSM 1411 / JCM 8866 / NBRC 14739 / NCIMB 2177 / R-4) TaxID=523841 RepID=I3RAV6_HALMT|nr:ParA family protein [Haloferax mediterranei]AFK21366.1 ParA family chromosome partitioning ATPase [Haloferax mediterranei ATCC 33500]AHZ24555.1 chromosome partitioning protein [Haloferax mediterranei ATCC 33500]ELZ97310.1 ParA family chromosome partitioning ATPase [Haloferax mediterranei ATCC 33500]MDX5990393.1 ParA family protein [Haloferax mediterranei ATCC 33500]QCQ76947.1 ParA family protein [Haloferax mediterranei ATCC 33500]